MYLWFLQVQELQDALEQRDKIIRQLTARLQETVAAKSSDAADDRPDYMEETQHLSQQVVLLQKQLTQVRIDCCFCGVLCLFLFLQNSPSFASLTKSWMVLLHLCVVVF